MRLASPDPPGALAPRRALGLLDATVLVMANVVGVGIFLTPGGVAALARTPAWYFGLWLCGGAIALAGALSYAELGAALPHAGGEYVYLREAYGPPWAFLHAWSSFLVTFSGAIAAIAVGAAEYGLRAGGLARPDAPLPPSAVRPLAIAAVLALTVLNGIGVKASARFQNLLTGLTLGAIVLLLGLGFAGGRGSVAHLARARDGTGGVPTWTALGAALLPIFFTFAGWNAPTYVAAEVVRPGRTIPRALALGTAATAALYLALNLLYVYAFPLPRLGQMLSVGEAAAGALLGPRAAARFAGLITLITLGALNVTIMAAARITYALGLDGTFLPALGALHPRTGTPTRALAMQAAWVSALIATGTFDSLLTFATVMMIAASGATVAAVFVLRARAPALQRPYRVWGYPAVPALYIAACVGMGASAVVERPAASLAALGLLAAGLPVFLWRAGRAPRA